LLSFVFLLGPTAHILAKLPSDLLAYGRLLASTFTFEGGVGDQAWQANWSVFYWAWWIAWAPFVGTFVARISRGRTIREFIFGVLLVPTVVTMAWLLVFGETAMYLQRQHVTDVVGAVNDDSSVAIYHVLEQLPATPLMTGLALVLVTVFFVTSSDSGSFVVDMLASGGHPNPPIWQRLFWAGTEGAVAIVLLLAGGLHALQSAVIATGLPFCLVLLLSGIALVRSLQTTAGRYEAPSSYVPDQSG
jgi:choline/glycine/proline betaine transport protein